MVVALSDDLVRASSAPQIPLPSKISSPLSFQLHPAGTKRHFWCRDDHYRSLPREDLQVIMCQECHFARLIDYASAIQPDRCTFSLGQGNLLSPSKSGGPCRQLFSWCHSLPRLSLSFPRERFPVQLGLSQKTF